MNYFVQNKILVFLIKYFRFSLIAIVVILLFISFYFLLLPKYNELQEEGGLDYEAKVKILEAKKEELEQLKRLRSELAKVTSSEIEKLEKILPLEKELPDIFLQMENLARESGLKVTRISIQEGSQAGVADQNAIADETIKEDTRSSTPANKKGSNIGTLSISLAVTGSKTYTALKMLLDNIEDNIRLVDINSLSFNPATEGESSYTINLKTYYLK